jgi:hypothetical protein
MRPNAMGNWQMPAAQIQWAMGNRQMPAAQIQ